MSTDDEIFLSPKKGLNFSKCQYGNLCSILLGGILRTTSAAGVRQVVSDKQLMLGQGEQLPFIPLGGHVVLEHPGNTKILLGCSSVFYL